MAQYTLHKDIASPKVPVITDMTLTSFLAGMYSISPGATLCSDHTP